MLGLLLLAVVPADRGDSLAGRGRLASLLTLVPASAEARVETIVEVGLRIGDRQLPQRPQDEAGPPDEAGSLAAVDDLGLLADAFDALSVQSAAFTTDVFRFAHDGGQLLRYSALATGATPAFLVIGMALPSAAAARENAARLRSVVETGSSDAARRPWSDLVGVSSIEVHGRVVVAVLSTRVPTLWLSLERSGDSLVWWSD
ncbi:MAG: hypothetical protein QOH79_3803 [Acidimicrobiaceae bacterium]